MRRKLACAFLLVGLCLGVVVTRAVLSGSSALSRGDRAQAAGEPREAIRHWRRAARWYVPLAPHVAGALDRLEELARAAEERGDLGTALAAWRGVRGSILATRSFYTPFAERLEPANRRIAAIMARVEGEGAAPGESEEERAAWHYELLAESEAPSIAWTVIALLGFALWIGGAVLFAVRGVSSEDRLVGRPAAWSGVLIAVGLLVWMLGLYQA